MRGNMQHSLNIFLLFISFSIMWAV